MIKKNWGFWQDYTTRPEYDRISSWSGNGTWLSLFQMFRSPYLLPAFNLALFSGLLVCQLMMKSPLLPWMLVICILGTLYNLFELVRLIRPGEEDCEPDELRSQIEKSAIMSDLDKEIVRRREIEKVEKN